MKNLKKREKKEFIQYIKLMGPRIFPLKKAKKRKKSRVQKSCALRGMR